MKKRKKAGYSNKKIFLKIFLTKIKYKTLFNNGRQYFAAMFLFSAKQARRLAKQAKSAVKCCKSTIKIIETKNKTDKRKERAKPRLILPLYFGYALRIDLIKIKQKLLWPFKKHWQHVTAVILLITLISATIFLNNQPAARAATYTWNQTSWSGGLDGGVYPDHTNNQSGWTKYSAKDAEIDTATAGEVKLSVASGSMTQTTDTDFNAGTFASTAVSGTGTEGSVRLGYVVIAGTGVDGTLDLSLGSGAGGCNGTGMSWAGSTCTINTTTKSTFNFTTINIPSGTTLTFTGTNYITLLATGAVTVSGTISANGGNGSGATGGIGIAGGSNGGNSDTSGGGAGGGVAGGFDKASGGAGFGGAGGRGGCLVAYNCGAGGVTYDTENSGGSGGGGGGYNNYYAGNGGGAGGGSIIIKSVGIITINSTGVIQANGGSNQTITNGMSSGGGGGSGGRINIQTFYNDIVNNGSITANGGAGTNVSYPGGGGGGGGGRITIKALNNITNNGLIQSYGEKGGNAPTCSSGTGGNGGGGGVLNLQDNDGLIIGTLTVSGGAGGDGCLAQDGVVGSSGTVTKSILPAYPYFSSGTFESATIDVGAAGDFEKSLSWNPTSQPANTTMTIQVAANNDNATWNYVDLENVTGAGGDIPSSLNNNRYLRYKVSFTTSDTSVTPSLTDITIGYNYYPFSSQTVTSSAYNTESSSNVVAGVIWNEDTTLPTGTGITISLRASSSSALIATTDWTEIASTTAAGYITSVCSKNTTTVTCTASTIPTGMKDGAGDQWIQYKVELTSTGANTPTLSDIALTYVVNAPPDFEAAPTASQDSAGLVNISYSVRDIDTTTGSCVNCVTPSFEYSLNNGGTWTAITSGLSANATTTKTVAEVSYTTHNLTWTAKTQIDGQYSTTAKIKVTVDDVDLANNTASSTTTAFTLDTTDPASASIAVAASTTLAALALSASDDSSLQMKISLNSDLSGASWQAYNSASTISLATDPDTVYVQFKDAYGNTSSIVSATTPETPTAMMVQDTSNVQERLTEYRLFVAWKVAADPAPGFSQYEVYRSTDGINYSLLAAVADRATNYYGDSSASFDTLYYYKVAVKDNSSNVSYLSSAVSGKANGVQDAGEGGGGIETTAPAISNVATSSVYSTQATITWDTDELSDSRVDYITSTGGDFTGAPYKGSTSMLNTAAGVGQHSITLTGLTPATDYYFQVRSTDVNSNIATSTYGVNGYMLTTPSGPIISATSTSDIKNSSAVISWTTDIAANSYIVYATTTAFSYTTETGSASSVTSHSVTLSGLSANTIYYYYIKSGDSIDNNAGEYYSFTTTSDTTAPTITFTEATDATVLSDTSARIVWTTSELATSTVEYGLDTSYASSTSNTNLNINQSITLSSLTKGTTYYFRLKSWDSNYNLRTDDNTGAGYTLNTTDSDDVTAPTISNANANPIMDIKAVINWTTNEAATSKVEYGTTSGTYTTSSSTTALDRSHAVILTGLTQNTTYYYHVVSADANSNTATSAEYSFATLETLSQESAVVAREATAYAEGEDSATPTTGGGILMIEKIVEKIVEKFVNREGEEIIVDKTTPAISKVNVESTGSDYAVITWNTDENSDSFVEYGADLNYNNSSYGKRDNTKSHRITLKWLNSSAIYHFRATSADSSGNVGVSEDKTFITALFINELTNQEARLQELTQTNQEKEKALAEKENILKQIAEKAMDIFNRAASQVSIASLERILSFQQDSIDKLANIIPAPVMSGEPKITVAPKSATIAWQTDKEANSLVAIASAGQYDPAKENPYIQVTGNVDAKTKNHLVTIYNLEPETVYHYQLRNKPTVGPVSKSKDFTFTTEKEILEIQNYTVKKVSGQEAIFQWVTTVESNSKIKYIPYRNNVLAVDEARTETDSAFTTIHEIAVDDFEAGVGYEIELSSNDISGNTINKLIPTFFTSEDDLPPLIYQVQTNSAISPGKEVKVQTIISWLTNEPATTRVYYQKGIGSQDELTESIQLDSNYTKKHVAVITKFEPGSVYRFKAESIDSGGNVALSKVYTILIPRQKETVFQIIMKNMEQTFGWVSKLSR
ncbi:fibronectin type III domain-containing protein [Patescibacteria group bacterium]|nr:fibronectin type III domain-containing protein [Patescibacteria group bacterium]